jgi:restriction endonuclease S subunit
LIPDTTRIDPRYAINVFKTTRFIDTIKSFAQKAVNQASVKTSDLREIQIPLPPLEVQKEIVAEIEDYQKVINGARAILDNYRPHIPINPDWPMVELGVICDLYQPKTITQQDLLEDGAYLVFGANGVIGRFDQYNHEEDEVLITCRGATCGTVNRSEPKSWITGNAMVAHPKDDRISKDFLFSLLKGSDLGPTISGSAQPQITRQGLAPFSIPLPPLAEQQAIVAEIEAEQALVNANRELITRFEAKIQTTLSRIWGDESSVS